MNSTNSKITFATGINVTMIANGAEWQAENARISAEETRNSSEDDRLAAEAIRRSNELARSSQENIRISAEESRVIAENARASFEEYNELTAYVVGNKVYYEGSSYQCILASTGNIPPNTTYWKPIALKGGLVTTANQLPITDAGNKFVATEVEGALLETRNLVDTNTQLISTHSADKANPHEVTKSQVGLGNADNTSDALKPLSIAATVALAKKVDKVDGKGLSANDYTDDDKFKLAGIEAGAEVNPDIADNLTTTIAGKVLDARQGKALSDNIGNQTYTEKNYIADGESATSSIDKLDIQAKKSADKLVGIEAGLEEIVVVGKTAPDFGIWLEEV